MTGAPFAPVTPGGRHPGAYRRGLGLLLDWLEAQPGSTWQDRWLVSGADAAGRSWRQIPLTWLRERGHHARWHHDAFFRALLVALSADLVRPSPSWLAIAAFVADPWSMSWPSTATRKGSPRLRTLCSRPIPMCRRRP